MSDEPILAVLSRIVGDLLGDDAIRLAMETERQDVPGWDSFTYVNFIVAVEVRFGIKFKVAEIESFPHVGAIVRRIEAMNPRLSPSP